MNPKKTILSAFSFIRRLFIHQETGENPTFRELSFFLKYLKPVMKYGLLCLLFSILLSGVRVIYPLTTKILIDYIFLKKNPAGVIDELAGVLPSWFAGQISWIFYSLKALIILMALLGVAMVIIEVLKSYVTVCFREHYTFHLQTDLFDHVLRFPLSYFKSSPTGYIMSRLKDDVSVLEYVFSQFIPQMLSNLLYIIFSVGILFALNTRLTIIVIILAPLFLLGNYFFVKYIRMVTYEERERRAYISGDLQEVISGIDVIKTCAAEERESKRISSALKNAIDAKIRNTMLNSFSQQTRTSTRALIVLAVLWFGGNSVLSGYMTVGDFVAYSAYIATFSGAINSLLSFPVVLQPALTSAGRILELFKTEPEYDGKEESPVFPVAGNIRFSDVSFAYTNDKPVLSHVSFTLRPGEVAAITGRTGAGKTTLAGLILKFYRPDAGRIMLDGHDISPLDPRWLREHISVVSQDLFLFNGTILHNIMYSRPGASYEMVVEAAKKAHVHNDIMQFSGGYKNMVGERGTQLSTGQRQRIAIARAFLKDAPILILDEPTSALDASTGQDLIRTLRELAADRTTIIISHRTSLTEEADHVYVIEGGELREIDKECGSVR